MANDYRTIEQLMFDEGGYTTLYALGMTEEEAKRSLTPDEQRLLFGGLVGEKTGPPGSRRHTAGYPPPGYQMAQAEQEWWAENTRPPMGAYPFANNGYKGRGSAAGAPQAGGAAAAPQAAQAAGNMNAGQPGAGGVRPGAPAASPGGASGSQGSGGMGMTGYGTYQNGVLRPNWGNLQNYRPPATPQRPNPNVSFLPSNPSGLPAGQQNAGAGGGGGASGLGGAGRRLAQRQAVGAPKAKSRAFGGGVQTSGRPAANGGQSSGGRWSPYNARVNDYLQRRLR